MSHASLALLSLALLLGLGIMPVALIRPASAGVTNTFQGCDIFTAIGYGQINWYRPNTCPGVPSAVTFQETLQVPQSGPGAIPNTYMTGMDFDTASCQSAGVTGGIANPNPGVPCLYATMFDSDTIAVFDNTGAFIGTCGAVGSIGGDPESVETVPGSGGPSYRYATGGSEVVNGPLPCNSSSTLTQNPVTGGTSTGGTDWVQVETDLCTVLYDGEGTAVLSNNICTHSQNPDFVSSGLDYIYAFKLQTDGSLIVADTGNVALVSNTGTVTSTCDSSSAGAGGIFSLDVLPGGAAFATGSFTTNQVDYLTVGECAGGQATPDFTFQSVQTGQSTSGLFGVAIYGEVEVVHSTTTSSSSTTGQGVPEFGAGSSTLLAAAVAVVAVAALARLKRLPVQDPIQ
jgi:hypothetical protein